MEYYKDLYDRKVVTDYYVKSRPTLPEKFFDSIYEFCEKTSSGHELAVDVGCGPGLSSVPLTKRYAKVVGADISQCQIDNAPTDVPGLSFHVAAADDLPFIQSGTADLVTVGVALHWFPLDRFYKELDRILKPGGSFAAYCQLDLLLPQDNVELKDYINHITHDVLGHYLNDGHRIVMVDGYQTMAMPYPDSKRIDDTMELQWTLDHLLGYIGSTDIVGSHLKDNPDSNLMEDIGQRFCEICHVDRDAMKKTTLQISAPLTIMMSRKPGNTEPPNTMDA